MKSRSLHLTLFKYHHVDITQESKMRIKCILEVNALKTPKTSWLHRASNNVEHFLLPTDAHNVKKRRVIKTF
jgi:hypothetical protein